MNAPKVISILIGILMTIVGIVFLFQPGTTFATLVLLLGIVLIFSSVTSLVNYFSGRSAGHSNAWTLITAILSLIAGILLISNHFARFFTQALLLTLIAIGILVRGILQVAEAITVKSIAGGFGMASSALLVLGILMIIAGIIFLVSPAFLMGFISLAVSLMLIVGGVSILSAGIAMPVL